MKGYLGMDKEDLKEAMPLMDKFMVSKKLSQHKFQKSWSLMAKDISNSNRPKLEDY